MSGQLVNMLNDASRVAQRQHEELLTAVRERSDLLRERAANFDRMKTAQQMADLIRLQREHGGGLPTQDVNEFLAAFPA